VSETVLPAQGFRETAQGEFGGGIGGLARWGDQAEQAGEVDDVGRRLTRERRHETADQAHGRPEIDGEQPLHILDGDLREGAGQGHAGIVDQHRHAPMGGEHRFRQGLHRRVVGDVEHVHADADLLRARLCRYGLEPGRVAVREGEVGAALREAQRQSSADAACGAGNHHRGVAEWEGQRSPHESCQVLG
jgi:hypothetical protein